MADTKEHQTKQSPVQEVIQAFGGLRPLAKALGVAVSTVQGWKERDSIPAARHEEILKAAVEQSLVLDVMLVRACDTARGAKPTPLKTAPLTGKSSIPESGPPPAKKETQPTDRENKETEKKNTPSVERTSAPKTEQQKETPQQKQKTTQGEKKPLPRKTPRFFGGGFFWLVLGLVVVGGAFATRDYWLPGLQTAVRFGDDGLLRPSDRPQSDDIAQSALAPDDVERRLRALEKIVADQQTLLAQSVRDFAALAQEQNRLASVALSVPSYSAEPSNQSAEGADMIRLQTQIDRLRVQLAQSSFAQSSDVPLYLVLSIFQLRDALRGSAPFVRELDLVRQAAQGHETLLRALDPLDALAAEGLPPLMSLKRDFPAMVRAVISADKVNAANGWLARAVGRVTDLASLRRIGLEDGQDLEAQIWRAENLLLEGDLDGAVQELRQLQGPARRAADDWLARADQRVQARLLLRQLTSFLGDLVARGGTEQ